MRFGGRAVQIRMNCSAFLCNAIRRLAAALQGARMLAGKFTGQSFAEAIEFFENARDGFNFNDKFFSAYLCIYLSEMLIKESGWGQATGGLSRKHVLAGWRWETRFGCETAEVNRIEVLMI